MKSHTERTRLRPHGTRRRVVVVVAAASVLLVSCVRPAHENAEPQTPVGTPLLRMLDGSTDLGPAQGNSVELTVALSAATSPNALNAWAHSRRLSVDWSPGRRWAYVAGSPADVGRAFGVSIHDYRSAAGEPFYAAAQDPQIPAPVRGDVDEVGRILSSPLHTVRPPVFPADVPGDGLTPTALTNTYNVAPLKVDGKGQTIVFFEIGSGKDADYKKFTDEFDIPIPLTPTEIGDRPDPDGETPMDLQVAHGIAPAAKKVIYYLPKSLNERQWAQAMRQVDDKYPGAVWSISLIWQCDLNLRRANLAPIQDAVVQAGRRGTSVFMSSGDNGGYECKGQTGRSEFFAPPQERDIGLNAVPSIPEVTSVGGTSLSTDDDGGWVTEAGWAEYPSGFGTGGGVSNLYPRPDWQRDVPLAPNLIVNHGRFP
ncbi:MAG: kumamolisin, partial [Mycobacterium sp.]|nr:kumamolisin [Mycobacterium sp.]